MRIKWATLNPDGIVAGHWRLSWEEDSEMGLMCSEVYVSLEAAYDALGFRLGFFRYKDEKTTVGAD